MSYLATPAWLSLIVSSIVLARLANNKGRGDLATPAWLSSTVLAQLANNKDKG